MTRGHVAGRRRRFAPRRHEVDERDRAGEVMRISFKVADPTPHEAIATAKSEARREGWLLQSAGMARRATDDGLWIVTFAAVRA